MVIMEDTSLLFVINIEDIALGEYIVIEEDIRVNMEADIVDILKGMDIIIRRAFSCFIYNCR